MYYWIGLLICSLLNLSYTYAFPEMKQEIEKLLSPNNLASSFLCETNDFGFTQPVFEGYTYDSVSNLYYKSKTFLPGGVVIFQGPAIYDGSKLVNAYAGKDTMKGLCKLLGYSKYVASESHRCITYDQFFIHQREGEKTFTVKASGKDLNTNGVDCRYHEMKIVSLSCK